MVGGETTAETAEAMIIFAAFIAGQIHIEDGAVTVEARVVLEAVELLHEA